MNWMIDGAYGDLYRQAMGYPQLKPHDEWEIERNRGRRERHRPSLAARFQAAARAALAALAGHFPPTAVTIPERKVS